MISLLVVYSHRQANENKAKKIKSDVSAQRSSLKPCFAKTSQMTPDFP
jgi:hypothetical protein